MQKEMRVRFAPSPTGPFHIGGARSALFNWLLARKLNGKMILRIEDTDQERSKPEFEENIKAALKWLNITWDEGIDVGGPNGPYRQMERLDIYQKYTEQLIAEGKAYYCYCTPEELEQERAELSAAGKMPRYLGKCRELTAEQKAAYEQEGRKPTVRFKVPSGVDITFKDMVRGEVHFDSDGIGDFVIVKADGIPTYNYAVVIDDALMQVSHVIRAEEHLSNTPRQLLVYDALGFARPTFGHISLILGADKKKMSKRHGATSVDQYRQLGYLPHALVNFLSLLGWAPTDEQEIFTEEELIKAFNMEHVAKNPAVFDIEKLNWINAHYMKDLSEDEYYELALPHLQAAGFVTGEETGEKLAWLKKVAVTAKTQASYGAQIPAAVALYFNDEFEFETEAAKAVLQEPTACEVLSLFLTKLLELPALDGPAIKGVFKAIQKETGLKGQPVYMPVRVALTGNQHGPELVEMIPLLGAERTKKRIVSSMAKAGLAVKGE